MVSPVRQAMKRGFTYILNFAGLILVNLLVSHILSMYPTIFSATHFWGIPQASEDPLHTNKPIWDEADASRQLTYLHTSTVSYSVTPEPPTSSDIIYLL